MQPTVFIDGEAGTTGLQIRERLAGRDDLKLLSIDPDKRKDEGARAELLNEADVAILCLPDDAARAAVELVTNSSTIIIDASSAHRTHPDWAYGFPELGAAYRGNIISSRRISNPGCYPTGFIALVKPLVDASIIPPDYPVTVNAVSGYSGGGKAMIAEFEAGSDAYRSYALGQNHKHPPEMRCHSGLSHEPVFAPAVGNYAQGMIVEVPLALWSLPAKPKLMDLWAALYTQYGRIEEASTSEPFVRLYGFSACEKVTKLEPEARNNTNVMDLFVFGNDEQARLIARFDNLGKGASGAAVQNLNLVLGFDEGEGL